MITQLTKEPKSDLLPGSFGKYTISTFTRNEKIYELANHLGNVLATIGDKKIAVPSTINSSLIDHFDADIVSAQDYYPFGMLQPGRSYNAGGYRYGFNGKERDNSIAADSYDYGDRMYNAQVGRWFTLDRMSGKYPNESHYVFVGNSPLLFKDPDGKDRIEYIRTIGKDGTVLLKKQVTTGLYRATWNATYSGTGYYTKHDYEVYTTQDYRSGKKVETSSENVLYDGNQKEVGFLEYAKIKITGKDGDVSLKAPQLVVFGSGSEDPGWGSKADPNRPITTIDYAAYQEMLDLVTSGMDLPDLKSTDPEKIPDFVNRIKEIVERRKANKLDNAKYPVGSDSCPICHKIEPKDSMNKHADENQNYHPSVVPTQATHDDKK